MPKYANLANFPPTVRVILGNAWSPGKNSLDTNDILFLNRTGEEDEGSEESFIDYTESGSSLPDDTNNRLKWTPRAVLGTTTVTTPPYAYISFGVNIGAGGTSSFSTIGNAVLYGLVSNYPTMTETYNFLSVWSGDTSGNWTQGYTQGFFHSYGTIVYNPDIFDSLQAAAAGDMSVLEGATPIPDGLTTPREYGSVVLGGSEPTKTFTVQNIGETLIEIDSVAVPTGYEIVQDLPDSIFGETEADLIIKLKSDTLGTFLGDIEIFSNDPVSPTYNWAITGAVVESKVVRHPRWGGRGVWGLFEGLGRHH